MLIQETETVDVAVPDIKKPWTVSTHGPDYTTETFAAGSRDEDQDISQVTVSRFHLPAFVTYNEA
jgi:hypothetical protein